MVKVDCLSTHLLRPIRTLEWEKLSIFLNFLVTKLPAPVDEDLSKGILEAIGMESYRVEKQAAVKILLRDEDAEIEPVPTEVGGRKPEPELDRFSNILKTFNDHFGNTRWTDADRVCRLITEDIPERVPPRRHIRTPDGIQTNRMRGLSTTKRCNG